MTKPAPKPEPTVIFTAEVVLKLTEAQRLKKLLDDAAIVGTGHWSYNEPEMR